METRPADVPGATGVERQFRWLSGGLKPAAGVVIGWAAAVVALPVVGAAT